MAKFVSIALICYLASVPLAFPFNPRFDKQRENFKRAHKKMYNASEERKRREIWENHMNEIIRHNFEYDLGNHTYRKGLNEYADMSHEEFKKVMNGYKGKKLQKANHTFVPSSNIDLPDTVDWRNQGLVTAVKNQKQCGSCWAFSTTGSLEGQHKKKTGNLVSLSEQNLVDCSRAEGSMGCNGGWMDEGFEYIKQKGGIDTEQSYPYTALAGTCKYNPQSVGATLTGFADVKSGSETALQQAVATIGPVSVAIDASQYSFQLYQAGIYSEPHCNPQNIDHAVLVVGYGTENGVEYWLVKNCWGTTWGDKGYIKMSRNRNNQCGIATRASYPVV